MRRHSRRICRRLRPAQPCTGSFLPDCWGSSAGNPSTTHWASEYRATCSAGSRGTRTSIHAHPQFAGYHFADGRFRLEIFEPAGGGTARPVQSAEVEAPCAFFAIGKPGCFDNHIHRITCLSPTGHSLHVYSDDALRGKVYGEADE